MKIVKLYFKRDEARELNRFYIRKVPDSRTIGIAICHDDSQYDYLKRHIKKSWEVSNNPNQRNKRIEKINRRKEEA